MFGFGKQKIDTKEAAQIFVGAAMSDAVPRYIDWEAEVVKQLIGFNLDPKPLINSEYSIEQKAFSLATVHMAASLTSAKNIFENNICEKLEKNIFEETSQVDKELADIVFSMKKQIENNKNDIFYSSKLTIKELDIDPILSKSMMGPIFQTFLTTLEMGFPVFLYWKYMKEKYKVII